MRLDDVARCAEALEGVRRVNRDGLAEWRYHGRLVVRQLDDAHIVIRAEFGYRDALLRESPRTFSVPARFAKQPRLKPGPVHQAAPPSARPGHQAAPPSARPVTQEPRHSPARSLGGG